MKLRLPIIIFILLGLSGCFGIGSSTTERVVIVEKADEGGQSVSFDITSSTFLQQVIPNQNSKISQSGSLVPNSSSPFQSVQIFDGTLTIKQGIDVIGSYPVTSSIDDVNWSVSLFQTFVLAPGTYTFELLLNRPNLQYFGATSFSISADQVNTIPLQIYPVIGNTIVDTQVISELGSFKFYYSDIPELQNFDPKLGVIVDGGSEQVFDISNDTGYTETYLNLTVGVHQIELKLYDGMQQKGRSIPAQESQTIIAGQNISMDIIPVYGEARHSISVGGSDATFNIEFPSEIVSQAGSLANLKVPYIINGPGTGYSAVEGELTGITYDSSEDVYMGSINQSGTFLYSTVYIYLSFEKIAEDELIGTCNIESSLNSQERTSLCNIPVTNSLISSGDLLGTIGVTVCEADASGDCGVLMGGVNIYDVSNDEFLGITGTGVALSTGFFKSDLKSGDYTIRATHSDGRFGEATFNLSSLEVENIEIILSASAPTNPNIVVNGGDQFTYSQYATLTLSAEDQNGISSYYMSEDSTTPGDGDWITATPNTSFSVNTSFQLSAGTGLKTVYAWFRNLSGHSSERVQSSITVQDNTALYYSNFAFTTTAFDSPFNGMDSRCLTLGSDYRIADWQEVSTIISQDAATDAGDFITAGGLAASQGSPVLSWWIGAVNPVAAFISYNGNEDLNGDYYAISVPSNPSRDIAFGWIPNAEPAINDNGQIQLYTMEVNSEGGDNDATVLCYRDSGVHPLMNGDFSDGMNFWDHVAGSAEVINETLALHSYDTTGDFSRAEQTKIAVNASTNYRLNLKAKTSTQTLLLTVGIIGGSVTDASYDELPYNWNQTISEIELSGESSDAGDNYYFDLQIDFTTDSTADELTLYLEFENGGTAGQSASIDDIVLTEL